MTQKALINLDNVSYQYPHTTGFALKDISLTVARGEFLGIIGPTGAGKTTLCQSLNGIVPQFYGGRFFGHAMVAELDTLATPTSTLAQHVGMVFEDPETQITATSVENEIAFALENLRVLRDEIRARIPRVLQAVRLEGLEQQHPHTLSGGQKQRLAIAAALALQPAVLVLDEPTTQLDPVGVHGVFATVRELNRELGITIVMVSHAAEEMAEYTDRVALLAHGELVQVGTPNDIYGDVPLLRTHHLRPPQVTETFYLMGLTPLPVRLQDAAEHQTNCKTSLDCSSKTPTKTRKESVLSAKSVDKLPQVLTTPPRRIIRIRDLHHTYPDGSQALHSISLDIHAGEYILIAGQNGAGKSTLVRHCVGLLQPTSGTVHIDGIETSSLRVGQLAHRIGYVAQNPDHQIFNTTVQAEVEFALHHQRFSKKDIARRVDASLEALDLLDKRDAHPLALPKGDRARVVIAAVLAMQPDVLIFDEPTTGQDDAGATAILDISRELHCQGKTIIVITHHLHLIPHYAQRAILMGQGSILLDAPLREAFHATEVLRATHLKPPQAVELAQMWGDDVSITPQEIIERQELDTSLQAMRKVNL